MVEVAENYAFLFTKKDKNKPTNYEYGQQILKSTKNLPKKFELKQIPDHLYFIWGIWMELREGTPSYVSLPPISYNDVANWMQVTGIKISPFVLKVIFRIDKAFLQKTAEMKG